MKNLCSRLNNRIEIWGNAKVKTDLGVTYEETAIKKVWADIVPISGSLAEGQAGTEANNVRFKITMRKTSITTDNYIIFKGNRYDISYICPDFNSNKYIEIIAVLKTE